MASPFVPYVTDGRPFAPYVVDGRPFGYFNRTQDDVKRWNALLPSRRAALQAALDRELSFHLDHLEDNSTIGAYMADLSTRWYAQYDAFCSYQWQIGTYDPPMPEVS